jgi:hypothetical protein
VENGRSSGLFDGFEYFEQALVRDPPALGNFDTGVSASSIDLRTQAFDERGREGAGLIVLTYAFGEIRICH